ncbi:hypothetical protein [Cyanobium sp. WAJ14-Wanaka]|uniref:hypothetical protein n=1 Tax=Cyanobium sp. WAJ14-Wanaka TaxID=2823725 RepID=UPI0020CF69A0|nr:hypothetical protein [Cyanobium sp. WAJ14-Wanaka]MCP9776170.1 hypothetical protein [Cyanobium sp. WAJ14-Wanaka]
MARFQIRTAALVGLITGAAAPLLALPLQANPKEIPFPSSEELRQIQLFSLDCGRENSIEPCQKARALADPLMDHPRLAASCKDTLWIIREQAKPQSPNTYQHREILNKAGSDVLVFCKQQTGSVLGSSADDGKGKKKTTFGLIQNQTP